MGAAVADPFPASLSGISYTAVQTGGATGFTAAGAGSIADTVNLPVGATITYTATASISSSSTGTLSNTATVTPPPGTNDPNPGNNTSTDGDTLTPVADLKITKTDGSASAIPGKPVTYTIVVTNSGPSDAVGATVVDNFPASLSAISYTAVQTGGATGFTSVGAGSINNTVTMPAGSTITYTATATVSAAATGTLANTATVTPPVGTNDPVLANNTATDTDTLIPTADLQITKTDGAATAVPGAPVTYTIVVTNAGPSNVVGAVVADVFPASLSGITYTAVQTGGATGFLASGSGNINNTVTMPAGSTITYTAKANIDPAATGSLSNTATVAAPPGTTDPTPGNNSATDTDMLTPMSDLKIVKTASTLAPELLSTVTYTVVVTNLGPSASTGVTATDLLPAGLTFVSATPTQGTYSNVSGLWTVGTIGLNATATLTVNATVNLGTTGQSIVNSATVTDGGGGSDPNPPNNTTTVTIVPLPCPTPTFLSAPVATPSTARAGQPVSFSVVASDAGSLTQTYTWDFGDGGTGTGPTPTHTYATPGQYTATVTSTNPCGSSASATVGLQVIEAVCITTNPAIGNPPDISVTFVQGGDGLTFTFTGVATDVEDGNLSNEISWDFGDGTFGFGAVVTHTYTVQNTYFVTAQVTDSAGNCRKNIQVVDAVLGSGNPGALAPAQALSCTLLNVNASFKKSPIDALQLIAQLTTPAGFNPAGQKITIQVAGLLFTATLNGNGIYKDPVHAIQIKHIGQGTIVTFKVAKDEFKQQFGMIVNANIPPTQIPALGVMVSIGGNTFAGNVSATYSSKINNYAKLKH